MFMELADERVVPADSPSRRIAAEEKMRLTAAWASSKLPLIANAATFGAEGVVIWRRWMREVPVSGKNTATAAPGQSAKPAMAADPVSPLVAASTRTRSRPAADAACAISTGSIDRATSLNAPVGPRNSSRNVQDADSTSGTGSDGKRDRRRATAARRTSAGMSGKNASSTADSADSRSGCAPRRGGTPRGTKSPPSGASPFRIASAEETSTFDLVLVNISVLPVLFFPSRAVRVRVSRKVPAGREFSRLRPRARRRLSPCP